MKTIIAGSRDIDDITLVMDAIDKCGWKVTEVVSGCARGIDQRGEIWAETVGGVLVKHFPAKWSEHGRSAGPIRNRAMAEYAEALICIHNGSPGSLNMLR